MDRSPSKEQPFSILQPLTNENSSQLNSDVESKILTDLPEEILLVIFSYLPKKSLAIIAQASKTLKRICYDPSLWKTVSFKDEKISPFTLGFVLSRGIKRLEINNCKFLEPFFLEEPSGCLLTHLEFAHSNGHLPERNYRCLLWILSCCQHLTSLALTVEFATFGDEFYSKLSEGQYLEILSTWTDLKFPGVLLIAKGCQRLRSWVYFGREIKMTDTEIYLLIDELAASIENISIFIFNNSVCDKHIAKLVMKCPNITDLHLQSCTQLTSEAIDHISSLKNLNYLNVSRCRQISSNSLSQLRNVKSLKRLVAFEVLPSVKESELLQSMLPNVVVDVFALPMTNDDYDD